ncbi:hypothetical protein ACFLY4_03755 [Chloroflexota bacterium]
MNEHSYVEGGHSNCSCVLRVQGYWRSSTRNHPNRLNEGILHDKLTEAGIRVVLLERAEPTLEDVFHSLATSGVSKGQDDAG